MKRRICVIGDSHIACTKMAWQSLRSDYPEVEITFFAHTQRRLFGLRVEEMLLKPDNEDLRSALLGTSGTSDQIDPANFDVIFTQGLMHQYPHQFQLDPSCSRYRPAQQGAASRPLRSQSCGLHPRATLFGRARGRVL